MTEDVSVTSFRNYLKINTAHPNPNYQDAVVFLQRLASEIGLSCKVVNVTPDEPVVLISWIGRDSTLPSILLNSHIDVVPVFRDNWTHDPFGAEKDQHGNIYARGSQDMKCVGIQYLEAIRRLKEENFQPLRTIHVSFVPDEEVGGYKGMALFVETDHFKKLNVAFGLDEGMANPESDYIVFYGERLKWWMKVTCAGVTGHGSLLMQNTAAQKFQKVVDKFLELREAERLKLTQNPSLSLGDVTTVNLTMVSGGVQVNVLPTELIANFDIRVTPTLDIKATREKFEKMALECGADIKVEWPQFCDRIDTSPVDDQNIWWKTFSGVLRSLNLSYKTMIFPAGTDARWIRQFGIPVFGFSPMVNTPILLHEHDEYLNESVFLKGLDIYTHLIRAVSNVP